MSEINANGNQMGFLGFLFLLFLTLKLTHVIDWSWWYVTMPLWAGIVMVFGVIGLVLAFGLIVTAIACLFSMLK